MDSKARNYQDATTTYSRYQALAQDGTAIIAITNNARKLASSNGNERDRLLRIIAAADAHTAHTENLNAPARQQLITGVARDMEALGDKIDRLSLLGVASRAEDGHHQDEDVLICAAAALVMLDDMNL